MKLVPLQIVGTCHILPDVTRGVTNVVKYHIIK